MAFVKLDCGMLDSTIWIDREARELFITALLMAEPFEATEEMEGIQIRTLEPSGFVVPVGWYGFVPASGIGITRRAGIEREAGLSALERLSDPESESRSPEFDGRRMVRVNGGFVILNFDKYRRKDHTAAERSRRYREKQQASRVTSITPRVTSRSNTQAEAEAEAEENTNTGDLVHVAPKLWAPNAEQLRLNALFRRKDSTRWAKSELAAWKAITPIDEDDMRQIERYYRARLPKDGDYRRRELSTLLNNWNGEVDKARNFKEPSCF